MWQVETGDKFQKKKLYNNQRGEGKMKNYKKILSMVLGMCMITGSMSVAVSAEEVPEEEIIAEVDGSEAADEVVFEEMDVEIEEADPEEELVTIVDEEETDEVYATGTMAVAPGNGTVSGTPFVTGTAGSSSYRIPAMVTLSDGTIVAAADARWNSTYDGGGNDTLVARSTDNGSTWSYSFANYFGDNGNVYDGSSSTAFIDPALAVAADDTVYMMVNLYPYGIALNGSGNTAPSYLEAYNIDYNLILSKDGENYDYYLDNGVIYDSNDVAVEDIASVDGYFNEYNAAGEYVSNLFFEDSPYKVVPTSYLYFTSSTDGGVTWSEPNLIHYIKRDVENSCLVSPGRGTILSDGTIIFPEYGILGNFKEAGFIYSYNGGATWDRSYLNIEENASEAAVVELNASTLRYFYRNETAKICYADVNRDEEGYLWEDPVETSVSCNSNTQLSAIKITVGGVDYILVSNPSNESIGTTAADRINGQIVTFLADDMSVVNITNVPSLHSENTFMNSCLTQLSNGDIAILYEDEMSGWGTGQYCQMNFKTFTLAELGIGSASFLTGTPEEVNTDLSITQQPENVTAKLKESVTFTVVAENAETYQWQYTKNGKTWNKSTATGATTDTLSIKVSNTNSANQYRCKITGIDGTVAYTDTVSVYVLRAAAITSQPTSVSAKSGKTVTFTVEADYATAYQWYYSKNGGKNWYKSTAASATTSELSLKASSNNFGNSYRCKITGEDGSSIYSSTVTLTKA